MIKYRYIDRAIAEIKLQQRGRESKNREDIDEDMEQRQSEETQWGAQG
jgi:hypothetical protein